MLIFLNIFKKYNEKSHCLLKRLQNEKGKGWKKQKML